MALHPGHRFYDQVLAGLFNGDAAAADPLAIVQPRYEEEVVAAVQQARRDRLALMVRSGGHSRFCAADGALMLDLSAHFTAIELDGDRVRVQGGVGMGTLLRTLAPHRRMVPVGTHATPGFGLLLMGASATSAAVWVSPSTTSWLCELCVPMARRSSWKSTGRTPRPGCGCVERRRFLGW